MEMKAIDALCPIQSTVGAGSRQNNCKMLVQGCEDIVPRGTVWKVFGLNAQKQTTAGHNN
jgi:hypothetical protein